MSDCGWCGFAAIAVILVLGYVLALFAAWYEGMAG